MKQHVNMKSIFSTFSFSVFIFSLALMLSGCVAMNSTLDCPMQAGLMCKSLDQVNNMVDSGIIGNDPDSTCKDCKLSSKAKLKNFNTPYKAGQLPITTSNAQSTSLALQHVWLAPYQDTDGNYHAETMISVAAAH